jgi:hypothetical protein
MREVWRRGARWLSELDVAAVSALLRVSVDHLLLFMESVSSRSDDEGNDCAEVAASSCDDRLKDVAGVLLSSCDDGLRDFAGAVACAGGAAGGTVDVFSFVGACVAAGVFAHLGAGVDTFGITGAALGGSKRGALSPSILDAHMLCHMDPDIDTAGMVSCTWKGPGFTVTVPDGFADSSLTHS